MRESFQKLLDAAKTTLILLPSEPDVDPTAAGLSLYLYLKSKQHQVSIACPSPMRVVHNNLVGVDKISSQVGDKNLVVKLAGYNPDNIDTVIWDIVNGEFQLNVMTKTDATPPQREQIKLDYHGIGSDFVVLIGGRESKHFPLLSDEKLFNAPAENGENKAPQLVHIGIEDLQVADKHNIISLAQPASSISELVASLFDDLAKDIESDIASNLLTGIYEGSANFTSQYVSANTFETVAALMKQGGKVQKKQEPQKQRQSTRQNFPRMRMPNMPIGQGQFMQGAAPLAQQTPGEYTETPEGETAKPPKEWTQAPKIYKGTSVS
jgi:hypothetical protein